MPSKSKNNIDFTLLVTILILLAIGVAMVFSASSIFSFMRYADRYHYLKSQGLYAIAGIIVMMVLSQINYKIWGKFSWLLVLITMGLLLLVLIIGSGAKGAVRWLEIGPIRMQPSELAKFALILFMAKSLSVKKEKVREFKQGILPFMIIMAIYCILIILEPNKSMAVNVAILTFAMLFMAGARVFHLIGWMPLLIPAGWYVMQKDAYSLARITSYLDPWSDPLGKGYQAIQSLYALGSGGIFGLGLGNSRQKFFYIPEPHNDFIFSIIGEELGFIGTATVVILFALLIWRGFRIALTCPDSFGYLLAAGITCMIGIQVMLNIAVATVTIPTTGVSLPFISAGGSSLLLVMGSMGILLNISKTTRSNGG